MLRLDLSAILGLGLLAAGATQAGAVTITVDTNNIAGFTMTDRTGGSISPLDVGAGIAAPAQSYYEVQFGFNLPAGALGTTLSWTNFAVDDRGVLFLNGTVLQSVGIFGPGVGTMQFAPTLSNDPWAFLGNGSTGSATSPFLSGANVLRWVINDTVSGIFGSVGTDGPRQTQLIFQGDITYRLAETSVPEPGTLLLLGSGLAGLFFGRRRKPLV